MCHNNPDRFPTAEEVAELLGLSLRTLHRRLARDGLSYQSVLDSMRRRVATEFLENTHLSMDQVAERVGFADATSFRKAFRKWTGHSPTHYRRGGLGAVSASPTGTCPEVQMFPTRSHCKHSYNAGAPV